MSNHRMSNHRVVWFALVVVGASSWSFAQQQPPQPQPAQPQPAQTEPVYFTRGLQFEEVDISRVAAQLRTFGIPIPVALQGNATVDISVSIPLNQLTNGRAYRVQGSLQSSRLQVDTFRFGELTAELTIADGVLSLTGVEGQFLAPQQTADVLGNFAGEASVELLPLGQFQADLRVEQLDARFLDQFLTEPIPGLAGTVDGVVELTAPVERIGDGAAFTATATLEAERLAYEGLSLAGATANLRLNEGRVELTSLAGQLQETPRPDSDRGAERAADRSRGEVRGTATVQLIPLGDVAAQVEIEQFDLALLETIAESPQWQFGGSADLTLDLSAAVADAGQITAWSGNGEFALERLLVHPEAVPPRVVKSARGEFEVAAGTFSVDPIRLDLDGLPLRGSGSVRLVDAADAPRGWSAAVQSDAAEVEELVEWLAGTAPEGTSGTVGFDLEASGPLEFDGPPADVVQSADEVAPADEGGPEGWRAAGTIAGAEIHVAGFRVGTLRHQLQLSAESLSLEPTADVDATTDVDASELLLHSLRADYRSDDSAITLQDLSLQGWGGRLRGEASWSLSDSGRHRAEFEWSDFQFTFAEPTTLETTTFETTTSGQIEWTAPASQLDSPAAHVFNLRATVADIHAADLMLGALEVSVDARQLPWQLRGSGQRLAAEELADGGSRIAETFRVASRLELLDGSLHLSDLRGELSRADAETPPLEFAGLAVAELSPLGNLAFELAADAVDLSWFNPWIPDGMGPFDGAARGSLRASVPLDEISRAAAWQGAAEVASPRWRMGEISILASSAELVLDEAVLVAERIIGTADGVTLGGRAAVELETDRNPGGAWQVQLQTGNAQAEDLFALLGATPPAETSGFVSFDIDASGHAAEPDEVSWQASGELSADSLRIAGFDVGRLRHHLQLTSQQMRLEPLPTADPNELRLSRLAADYRADDLGWQLRDLRFEGWGGTLSGNALWSRDPEQAHRAEFRWAELRIPLPLEMMGVELPGQKEAAVHALTAGSLAWSAPPTALSNPSAHRFTLQADVRELTAGGVEWGELELRVDALDSNWEIGGTGTLLSGPAELTATADVARADSWEALIGVPADGKLTVGPMQLGNLFRLWQPPEGADGWSGVASLQWTITSDGQSPPQSLGQIRINNLVYRNQTLTERLEVELASTGGAFDLRALRGTYAGGRIEGSGRWATGAGPRQLIIRLSSIDASRAALPVVATSGDWFDGRLSADLVVAGRGGPREAVGLRVNGRMELRNGETFGLQSRSLRARVQGAVRLPSGRWSLQLSDLQVNRGRGRVVGQLRLDQSRARSDRVDLDSQFEATDLDFQDLLEELAGGGPTTFGSGSLTGTATLRGRAIESFADLEGRIVGRLDGTDATAVPGLLSAQNYLGVLSLRNTDFNRGEIEARLRQGELQIFEFWLSSDQLRLWADGSVSLRSGRLDIDAVAATGDFRASNPAILALARTVALDAALPISVITRTNELLSNRVVRLALGGTYQRPAVRVLPAATLSQNAARFFLREAAGIALPASGQATIED